MHKGNLLILAMIAVLVGIIIVSLMPAPNAPEQAVAVPTPPAAPANPAAPAVDAERYPIVAEASSSRATEPINIEDSDSAYRDGLQQLVGAEALAYFYPDRMIRRFVATIDNLPRQEASAKLMPVKPVDGPFLVERSANPKTIDPANAQRYVRYLEIMAAIDVKRLVDMYISFYPVFQQAYRELGYPRGYFNDRLVDAIDDLLATPDVAHPLAVVQPKVLYKFADPELEKLSAGQKIMLRMGAENMARAKILLIAIRGELLRRSPGK
ncbi:MAG TPA: DUF3014 domain-containing protein [Azonexus sp.]